MNWSQAHKQFKQTRSNQEGFSLMELLVVIFIIGVLSSIILTNLAGIRQRAKDSRSKSELDSMKKALRMYYNDHQSYPTRSGDDQIDTTYISSEGYFEDSTTGTTYMRKLPDDYKYFRDSSGDDFRLRVELENLSDEAIAESQAQCPLTTDFNMMEPYYSSSYIVCAD